MEMDNDLIAASSTPIVLAILSEQDSYGYNIIKQVRAISGEHIEWADAMIYPVLHRLERLGHLRARWEVTPHGRRRKYYSITSKGRARLADGGSLIDHALSDAPDGEDLFMYMAHAVSVAGITHQTEPRNSTSAA